MTGSLAQEFAQVREALQPLGSNSTQRANGRTALSAIERHVQDMARWEQIARDYRYSDEFLGAVVRKRWPKEWPGAALPAREKGTE